MMRHALIALVMITSITGTSVASVPSENTNVHLSLVTNQPVPLKIEREQKNFELALNTKSHQPIKVVRTKQVTIKSGKSNAQITKDRELASQRKGGYVDTRPVYGTIPSDAAYKKWLTDAAKKYGVSSQTYALYRVMMGESGGNPYAQNASGASGLFQFMPSTWRNTPYGGCSIWDAKSQCYAAAWMFSCGRQREWVVYNMYF
jgi:hypothetical protein